MGWSLVENLWMSLSEAELSQLVIVELSISICSDTKAFD